MRLQRLIGNRAVASLLQRMKPAVKAGKSGGSAWKPKEVGGALLQWNPYGEKTLVRLATQQEHDQYVNDESYKNVEHKNSKRNAVWFKADSGGYEADFASDRPWIVTVRVSIGEDTPLVHCESEGFKGEAGYPDSVIVKNDEKFAYGIGRGLVDRLQPVWSENQRAKK